MVFVVTGKILFRNLCLLVQLSLTCVFKNTLLLHTHHRQYREIACGLEWMRVINR